MKLDLNKIIEQFNSLNDQARYAVLGGVVLLIILLDVFLLVLPQIGGIGDVNDQIKKMSDDTQEVLTDRLRIRQLRKNLQATRDQYNALNAKVRPIQEVPVILSTISSIANEYGVKIDQLVPDKSREQTLKAASADKYYALPVLIKARCGYHMFGHFLNKLENADMYFIMSDFIIQNDGQNTDSHLFSLTINVVLVDKH
jgi:Tfp pilus assembly protein PilO